MKRQTYSGSIVFLYFPSERNEFADDFQKKIFGRGSSKSQSDITVFQKIFRKIPNG